LRPNAAIRANRVVTTLVAKEVIESAKELFHSQSTHLCFKTFMIINLAFVDVFASARNLIQGKANLAVASVAAWNVCTNLMRIANIFDSALVNILRKREEEDKEIFNILWNQPANAKRFLMPSALLPTH